jgi:hypothetical protein
MRHVYSNIYAGTASDMKDKASLLTNSIQIIINFTDIDVNHETHIQTVCNNLDIRLSNFVFSDDIVNTLLYFLSKNKGKNILISDDTHGNSLIKCYLNYLGIII